MRERLNVLVSSVQKLRGRNRERALSRAEQRWAHHGALRELAELAVRALRRRRLGDGRNSD